MLINNLYNYNCNIQKPAFKSNPNSARLQFQNADFFINIKGYGKNADWAKEVKTLTDKAAQMMRNNCSADEALISIAEDMQTANSFCSDKNKAYHTGILRTKRKGYDFPGLWAGQDLQTAYDSKNKIKQTYISYKNRFDKIMYAPLKKPYADISLTIIDRHLADSCMFHGKADCINNALDRVGGKYFNLKKDYILKPENVTSENLDNINSDVAEIRWIMAHATPWERGSDAIANSFMRALYKSMGIKTYPAKKGLSFDLEAYCTNLADYKKNFSDYFEKPPEIVE